MAKKWTAEKIIALCSLVGLVVSVMGAGIVGVQAYDHTQEQIHATNAKVDDYISRTGNDHDMLTEIRGDVKWLKAHNEHANP